jgi:hypothetical protein
MLVLGLQQMGKWLVKSSTLSSTPICHAQGRSIDNASPSFSSACGAGESVSRTDRSELANLSCSPRMPFWNIIQLTRKSENAKRQSPSGGWKWNQPQACRGWLPFLWHFR